MPSVEVLRNGEKWLVRVNDGLVDEREFLIRENALAWASGHRKRLGITLDPIEFDQVEQRAEPQTHLASS